MSKNKKAGKKLNPNRPRSKNNPVGKRNDPQINWAEYNRGRRAEGQRYTEWMRRVADKARHIMGIPQGRRDWRVWGHTGIPGQVGGEGVLLGAGEAFCQAPRGPGEV